MGSSGESIKLLGSWQSPFALRARIALNMKSVAYDFQQEHVLVAKSNLLLKSNPVQKKIPVLLHDGKPICESLVIVQYIDEVWPSAPAILPTAPYDRAIARFWSTYIDDNWFKKLIASLVWEGEDANKSSSVEDVREGLVVLEGALAECSGGKKFFGGDEMGYVDIALGCFLPWISVVDKARSSNLIDESNTPNLFQWAQRFRGHVAVRDILPDVEELYDFSKLLVSVMKVSAAKVVA